MIKAKFDDSELVRDIANIVQYTNGFAEGARRGKAKFLENLAVMIKESAENYVDSSARVDEARLHHVYEWYMTGSPEARLFNISYRISTNAINFNYEFSQSRSVKRGSNVPFYDKATIMERGTPVTIRPKRSDVLVFDENGETIFTKKPVIVNNPGGNVAGQFEKVLDSFFNNYLKQSFMSITGIEFNLKNPVQFAQNLKKGRGYADGVKSGYNWIVGATI